MTKNESNIKRIIDLVVASVGLCLTLPFMAVIVLVMKLTSRSSVFYKQERVGRNGKEFYMYKLRTMYENAENDVPKLTQKGDKRITPIGKWLRKYHIDELPQLYNVLKGDMSIVGPRPERAYFIKQILKQFPDYARLLTVRPGITSEGMVHFGYADSVKKMIERSYHDLDYLSKASVMKDAKIILYTLKTILEGKGI